MGSGHPSITGGDTPVNPTEIGEGVFPDVISAIEILGTDGYTKADARQRLGFHAPTLF
jgi:hypothetical protein